MTSSNKNYSPFDVPQGISNINLNQLEKLHQTIEPQDIKVKLSEKWLPERTPKTFFPINTKGWISNKHAKSGLQKTLNVILELGYVYDMASVADFLKS